MTAAGKLAVFTCQSRAAETGSFPRVTPTVAANQSESFRHTAEVMRGPPVSTRTEVCG